MYCPKCGTKLDDSSIFCHKCGYNIKSKTTTISKKHLKSKAKIFLIAALVILIVAIPISVVYSINHFGKPSLKAVQGINNNKEKKSDELQSSETITSNTNPGEIVKILPEKPTLNDNLKLEISGSKDSYKIKWYKNNEYQPSLDNKYEIDKSILKTNDSWYAEAVNTGDNEDILGKSSAVKITIKILFTPTIDWLYGSESVSGICIANSDGSDLKRFIIIENPSYCNPTFSPDGSKITFHYKYGPGGSIFIMNNDGSNFKKISDSGFSPLFSIDNERIIFVSEHGLDTGDEISTMNLNGSDIKTLLKPQNDFIYYDNPKYSHDGGKIIFIASDNGFENMILNIMDSDGSNLKKLIDDKNMNVEYASFSPDDKKVVFSAHKNNNDSEIYMMNLESLEIKRLTDNKSYNFDPYFSPEGEKIVFYSNRNGFYGLYIMDINGDNQELIMSSDMIGSHNPTYSLDGSKIAFESNKDGNPEIYLANSDGTNLKRLTNNKVFDGFPTFSPDGQKLAFFSCEGSNCAIWIMDLNTHELKKIDDFFLEDRGVVSEYYKSSKPIFSPDGEKLLYFTKPDSSEHFNIINIDGTGKKILNANASFFSFYSEHNKVFSSDSRKIYFIGNSQENNNSADEIFSIDIENNAVQQLTHDNLIKEKLFFSKDKVIFEAWENGKQNSDEFYIMNSDGSNMEKLSSVYPELINKKNKIPLINENGLSIININEDFNKSESNNIVGEEEPIFSPDGSKIIYVAFDENGIPDLYIINTDGTQKRKLISSWVNN